MSNDNNLITRKTLNEYLKRFNSKINKTNFRNAYIVGSTPLASDWLSDTDGGTPITPEKSKLYVIKTSGSYENFVYTYDGTSYVQPIAGSGSSGGIGIIKDNTNTLTITQSNDSGNLVYQISVNKADTVNENDLKTIIDDLSNNQLVDMSSYSDNKFVTEKQFVTILSKLLKDYALKANVSTVKPNNPTNTNP